MKARTSIPLLAGLVALGALFASWQTPPAPEPVAAVPPRPPARASPQSAAPASAPVALAVPALLAPPEEIPGEEGQHGEFTTATDLAKQKLFKREPGLARFDYFREHVLLDSQGRADYQVLLADKALMEHNRRALLHPPDEHDTMESNVERLLRIDYLRESLAWKDNPERGHLMSEVERIILEDSFSPTMPADVKRSLAATKLELYELLYDQSPERARALVGAARRTRLEKMMEYIAERNQSRLRMEHALSLQAQTPRTP
ncbi:MAG: hypothetical protein ABW123_11740 [Cystobacter sp.]